MPTSRFRIIWRWKISQICPPPQLKYTPFLFLVYCHWKPFYNYTYSVIFIYIKTLHVNGSTSAGQTGEETFHPGVQSGDTQDRVAASSPLHLFSPLTSCVRRIQRLVLQKHRSWRHWNREGTHHTLTLTHWQFSDRWIYAYTHENKHTQFIKYFGSHLSDTLNT